MQGLARVAKKKQPDLPNVNQPTPNVAPKASEPPVSQLSKLSVQPPSDKKGSSTGKTGGNPLKKKSIEIDKYKLGEEIGKGAYSTVYKALNIETGNFVAVKRIKRKKMAEDALKIEMALLKTFDHPHIVRYIDVIVSESHVNLILEYIESGSLANVTSQFGVFPEPLVALYLEQVLQGLTYLHENGVIHRDIKGPNLLITKEGVIKLADFGIAITSYIEDDTTKFHGTVVEGSPFWMAPELIGMSKAAPPSDIWSLACTVIELITGYPPYFDNSGITALYRMVNDPHPPLPDDISAELKDFLMQCFQKDAQKRPTAKALLNHPWIAKHSKTEKKTDWRGTLRKVQKYNTAKREAAIRGIQSVTNMDWSQLSKEPANNHTTTSSTTSNNNNNNNNTNGQKWTPLSPPGSASSFLGSPNHQDSPDLSRPLLMMGHTRSAPIVLTGSPSSTLRPSGSSNPAVPETQFFAIVLGTEARKNFLFSYIVYKIKVAITYPKESAKSWIVYRSYSEITDMDEKIKNQHAKNHTAVTLPDLPKVKWFSSSDPEYLGYIQQRLGDYLKKMVEIPSTHKLLLPFLTYENVPVEHTS